MSRFSKKQLSPPKTHAFRIKFVFLFFAILSASTLLIFATLILLERQGIHVFQLKNKFFYSFVLGSFILTVLCVVISFFVAYFLMNMVIKPLDKMSDASKKIAKGDYNVQLKYHGTVREIETTIHNFNHMAKELNSVEMIRKDFIANVSHEFKTPLSSIMGYVTLLQDSELSEEKKRGYIQKIFFNIYKLNDLTDNILQISKLESQNHFSNPVTYRLDEQIREAIVILEPKWSEKKIELDIELEKIKWTGQKSLLFQVWMNLISNAIKFSNSNSKILIRLSDTPSYVKVTISDNGIGMSPETQAHIFEKFYQGDTSRREQGNGLGLALCKTIIEKCHGKIYVTSALGKGSVFMVVLPKVDESNQSTFT